MAKYEPTSFEVIKSYKNVRNTDLARAVFAINAWWSYDRCQAHTWALRLIHENPQSGRDVAGALTNFDHMIQSAQGKYDSNKRRREQCDEIYTIYAAWKADAMKEAA